MLPHHEPKEIPSNMTYYIIASQIQVMKRSFLSPFPSGELEVTNEIIANAIGDYTKNKDEFWQGNFDLFTEYEDAINFASNFSTNSNDTVAAYYIEFPPVIEVTLKDEKNIINEMASDFAFWTYEENCRSITFDNIDKINGYYYRIGPHNKPTEKQITFDRPLSFQELSEPTNTKSCVIF